MYLVVLQMPAGLRQAQVKQIQLSASKLSYQKDPLVGPLQSWRLPEQLIKVPSWQEKCSVQKQYQQSQLSALWWDTRVQREKHLQSHIFLLKRWHPRALPSAVDRRTTFLSLQKKRDDSQSSLVSCHFVGLSQGHSFWECQAGITFMKM